MGPALGILELGTIARGIRTADAIVKRAQVTILASRPVSGGKHLIFLRGEVAEIEEAMAAGREIAEGSLVDSLELPMAHEQIWPLCPEPVSGDWDGDDVAAAIVETDSVCAAIAAADAACKATDVLVRDCRLAVGIAGKAFFTMTGELTELEAAADAAREVAGPRLIALEVIPAPAAEIVGALIA